MSRSIRGAMLAVPALLLAACGGGGGGGEAAAPAPTVSAVAITSTNAKPVAADALSAGTNLDAAQVGTSLVTGVEVDGGAATGQSLRLAAAARKFVGMVPASTALATGVSINETVPCEVSGSLTFSGEVAGGSAMVAGDNLTVTASACKGYVDGTLVTMTGSMTLRVTSGSYSETMSYPRAVGLSIVTRSFGMADASATVVSDGDLQIDLNESSATSATAVVSGTSLRSSVTTGGGTHSVALKDYRQALTIAGSLTTLDVAATVETNNSRISSSTVSYGIATPTPIQMTGSDYTAGSLRVTGASSALLLTVTGTNAFELNVDTDGNGTWDSTTSTTRSELQSLL